MPPEKPRIAAELRIRVTSSDDLSESSFESGSDLLRTDSQPWSRPIYILSKYYSPLYEKLREERLVPDDLDAVLSTLPSTKPKYDRRHLFTLNDTFIIDFSNYASTFFVVTEQGVESLRIYGIFYDTRVMHKATPYTGSALARFERSTLSNHKGTRTIVLRFLKIITPVRCVIPLYDDYVCCPNEGELHRRSYRHLNRQVWSVDIDVQTYMQRGLRLLWDT